MLPERFTTLYRAHHAFVWRCARRLGVPVSEVDDVVQETFVVVLRRLDSFDGGEPENPNTWLFAVLSNVLRNRARGDRRRARKLRAVAEARAHLHSDRAPARIATARLARRLLDDFLATLDDDRRAVYVLAELEGANSREIGAALGISPNTARSRLRAARSAFEAHFDAGQGAAVVAAGRDAPDPSPARREATLAAIASPLVLTGAVATPTALGVGAWLTKFGALAAAVTGGLAVAGVVVIVARDGPTARPASSGPDSSVAGRDQSSAQAPAPAERASSAPELASSEAIAVPSPSAPSASSDAARSNPTGSDSASSDSDSNESTRALAVLADARAALVDGRADHSLELLATLERWPSPTLAKRSLALEVSALCTLERRAEAKAAVDAWLTQTPNDPLPAQILDACW